MRYSFLPQIQPLTFLFVCFSFLLQAQNTGFHIEDTQSSGGQNIQVDITVSDFEDILSFDFSILWDTNLITYDTFGNLAPLVEYDADNFSHLLSNKLTTLWYSLTETRSYSLDDGTVLFSVFFTSACDETSATDIIFDSTTIIVVTSVENEDYVPMTISGTLTFSDPMDISNISSTPITCHGADDACIEITPTDGRSPYSYLWSNGATTAEICDLAPGSYTCTVTDAGNCTAVSTTIDITEPDLLEICGNTLTDPTCLDGDNGCIEIEVCGGTTAYTYNWSNGGNESEICNLTQGSYSCTVTDAMDCTTTMSFSLSDPSNPLTLEGSSTQNASCAIGGSIDLTVNGGADPYEYNWSNGDNTQDIDDLSIGTYACTITDDNGCSIVTPIFTIEQSGSDMTASQNVTHIDCYGESTGAIDLTASSSAGSLSFAWSNGATTEDIDQLSAGFYTCTVTDGNGCTLIAANIEVEQPDAPIDINAQTIVAVLCHGENSGSISLEVGGGTPGYTYLWSTGATTSGINNLSAGSYICTITDNNGCTLLSGDINVEEPSSDIFISNEVIQDVSCPGDEDGSITFATNGGTPEYSYLWSNDETTASISDLAIGQYQCTITDFNGCTFVTSLFEVGAPTPILINNDDITDANCSGGGAINLSVEGGNPSYTFQWSNGSTGNPLSDVGAGTYTCTITDQENCSIVSPTYTIELLDSDLVFENSAITSVSCFAGNDGAITITIDGSATPFDYNWSNNAPNSASISNLNAGAYSCTVTDNTGCSIVVDDLEVFQPEAPLSVLNITTSDVLCHGEATGTIELEIQGGTAPYTYLWNTGDTGTMLSGLEAGTYTCTVTDNQDCTFISNAISLSEPSTSVAMQNLVVSELSCHDAQDGSISLEGTGGTVPYTYLWSNGATGGSISGLGAGAYQCTISDDQGCTFISGTIEVGSPSPIVLSGFDIDDASCNEGGSVALELSGGSPSYTYLWSNNSSDNPLTNANAGSYTCTITDSEGCTLVTQSFTIELQDSDLSFNSFNATDVDCYGETNGAISLSVSGNATPLTFNWSNGANTQNITNLSPGTYTCTITDNTGCSVLSPAIEISQPATALSIDNILSDDLSCADANDGSISLQITGGTMPYAFSWVSGQSSAVISNLPAGDYICTVTDDHGCTSLTPVITIAAPPAIVLEDFSLIDASCGQGNSGSIDISISGGAPPLNYLWNNGATSQDLNGISSGTYICTITDAMGCTFTTQEFVIINSDSDLAVNTGTVTHVSCFGNTDGSISLVVSGTATPFTFSWNNGASTQNIQNLTPGIYICTITDANGCSSISSSIQIVQPDAALAIANITITNISCSGGGDGSITLEVSGGTMPYTFNWGIGSSGDNIDNLPPGEYICEITDANGCQLSTESVIISEPDPLTLNGTPNIVNVVCGQNDLGSIDISISGGTMPYNYLWSNGATTEDLQDVPAGIYTCTLTDNNGCVFLTDGLVVNDEGSDLQITEEQSSPVTCFGGNDGTASVTVSGSATPFTYEWSNGVAGPTLENLPAGTYTCMITDANGCFISSSSIEVSQPDAPITLANSEILNPSCAGEFGASISIEITGGTPPYLYLWNTGDTDTAITDLPEGEYTCTVTDANDCMFVVGPLLIENNPMMTLAELMTGNAACTSGGFIDISITGGSPPYTYEWNNGTSDEDLTGIPAGSYQCTISDSEACTFVTDEINIFNDGTDLMWNATDAQDITCFGDGNGAIDISISGSATPFTYSWNNGADTEDIDNLSPGLYSCTISDAMGCSITIANIAITEPESPLSQLSMEAFDPSCADVEDGGIVLDVGGGVAPYNYQWDNTNDQTEMPMNLPAGNYTCTVTDANGCTFVSTTATLISPPAIVLDSEDIVHETNGDGSGSISIVISGGVAPLSYLWSNGGTEADISGLSMGEYSCTVTDTEGCTMVFGPFIVDNIVPTVDIDKLGLRMYPNPLSDVLYFESNEKISSFRIWTVQSQLVQSIEMNVHSGSIDLSDLATGVFIIEIDFDNGTKWQRRLVKVHP